MLLSIRPGRPSPPKINVQAVENFPVLCYNTREFL